MTVMWRKITFVITVHHTKPSSVADYESVLESFNIPVGCQK
jgi:hypothetical protein